jgi:hypothetical protein
LAKTRRLQYISCDYPTLRANTYYLEDHLARWKTLASCVGLTLMLAASPTPAQAQARRLIYVQNACQRPVRVILYYADAKGTHQQGWYYFNPTESSYLRTEAGSKLTQIEDQPLYAYAETTDAAKRLHWQGEGPEMKQDGGIYRSMPLSTRIDADGDLLARITCN